MNDAERAGTRPSELDVNRVRLWVTGLLIAGVATFLIIDQITADDSRDEPFERGLSQRQLLKRAESLEQPVFWVGPLLDRFELTATDHDVYIRYLSPSANPDEAKAGPLTVGTYRLADAQNSLRQAAQESGGRLSQHDGYEMLTTKGGHNVYVAFDDYPKLQIEVFSPDPNQATALVTSGSLSLLK